MRRRITMLVMAAMLALTMSLGGAGAAFAATPACEAQTKANWTCQGNKLENKGGKEKGTFTGQP
jgi:hypothetical protein